MERDVLLLTPLELDGELVRRHQNATATLHQLRASIDQLLPAHDGVVRQSAMERLTRLEKSARLDVDIEWYLGELTRLRNRQQYAERQLARCEQLAQQDAATESELDACREQTGQLQREIENVHQRVENLRNEKSQVDEDLREFGDLTQQQQVVLNGELEHARQDRAAAEAENRRLAAALDEDLERAGDLRDQQLEQLRLKIEECRAELTGAEQTLVVRAPFDGVVVFRDPSPRAADEHQPLLVLGRESGFRMRLRLPRSQMAALEEAGEVTIELVDPAVEPYFGGRFLRARSLPHKRRYVVAELACHPPRETVRELVEGEEVNSRLVWRPPLVMLWPFQAGAVALILGMAARIATAAGLLRKRQRPKTHHSDGNGRVPAGSTSPIAAFGASSDTKTPGDRPLPCAARLESGSVAAMLELLGARLREAVLNDEVDEDLVSTLEWALDRHHVRAVRRLRAGLDCDELLEQRVGQLLEEAERTQGNGDGHLSPRTEQLDRVLRVLEAVEPRLSRPKAARC
jgi:predicted  nucleic acid-binding Zn-ribbon protein